MSGIPNDERALALEFLPPIVYVAASRTTGPDGAEIELRQLDDGRVALLAYSALDRLARCCGVHQRWVLVAMNEMGELQRRTGFDTILIDVGIPEELQHTVEDML